MKTKFPLDSSGTHCGKSFFSNGKQNFFIFQYEIPIGFPQEDKIPMKTKLFETLQGLFVENLSFQKGCKIFSIFIHEITRISVYSKQKSYTKTKFCLDSSGTFCRKSFFSNGKQNFFISLHEIPRFFAYINKKFLWKLFFEILQELFLGNLFFQIGRIYFLYTKFLWKMNSSGLFRDSYWEIFLSIRDAKFFQFSYTKSLEFPYSKQNSYMKTKFSLGTLQGLFLLNLSLQMGRKIFFFPTRHRSHELFDSIEASYIYIDMYKKI